MVERARSYSEKRKVESRPRTKVVVGQFDFTIFFIVVLLILFGIVMIFSSSYYSAMINPKISSIYFFLSRQVIWSVLGIVALFVMTHGINYKMLKQLALPAYLVSIALLALVLILPTDHDSKRWLGIGEFSFQPSEAAKIAVILYLSKYISDNKNILSTFKGLMKCLVVLFVPVVLIGAANLSTAIVVTFIGFCLIFLASPKIWYFFVMGGVGAVLGAAGLAMFAYRMDRVRIWMDPFSDPTDLGFQIVQSLYAIGSGGLFGRGLGQSIQKLGYIPEAHNDIIFSIICEELGFIGAAALLTLFMILIWRGIQVSINAVDMFSTLVSAGIIAMIGVQVLINVSVATNVIPNTGIPLPFISYGGTSLLFTMASMGILLNISKYSKKKF